MPDLCEKYRPKTLEEVIGQDHAVNSIRAALKRKDKQTFVITGYTGAGKTSLARIIARELGCDPETSSDYLELNVGVNNGIDAGREVAAAIQYVPQGEGKRVVVFDEAHAGTKQFFSSLLKPIEEPSAFNYFIFATTEKAKLLDTILGRALCLELHRVSPEVIYDHLKKINKAEKITENKDGLKLISKRCNGSVRTAISQLAAIGGAKSLQEIELVLGRFSNDINDDTNPAVILCKAMQNSLPDWNTLMKLCVPLKDADAEGTRRLVLAWFSNALLSGWAKGKEAHHLAILEAFSQPRFGETGAWPTILSLGSLKFS